MTRAEVMGGSCAAVIWLPPFETAQSRRVTEILLPASLHMTAVRRAVTGEASDTGDAYLCFGSMAGQEGLAVKAIKAFVEENLADVDLTVLGPFSAE